jgi:hypothetical protein
MAKLRVNVMGPLERVWIQIDTRILRRIALATCHNVNSNVCRPLTTCNLFYIK